MNQLRHELDQEAIDQIKEGKIPVLIFGAGIVGEALFHACRDVGVPVEGFCDNNINITRAPICGVRVFHAFEVKKKYPEAIFLIAAADVKDVADQLREMGYGRWYVCSPLLRNQDFSRYELNAPLDFVEYAVATCLLCHDSYLNPEKLFLRSVDLIITERCSLKCKDCSNLMQYYKKPADCESVQLIRCVDAFCEIIDEVNEFRVIGGEPFMNKDFHLITNRLIAEPKVKRVVIYTNGTIVPRQDQIRSLKDEKTLVLITDYGALSKNRDKLVLALRQNDIAYYAHSAKGWAACSRIMKHDRNEKAQKDIFKSCCAKNTFTLSNGMLFRCPFSANAVRLRAIPFNEGDCVPIFRNKTGAEDLHDLKRRIRSFVSEREYLPACDYCDGRPFGASEIVPAVQAPQPIGYVSYGE